MDDPNWATECQILDICSTAIPWVASWGNFVAVHGQFAHSWVRDGLSLKPAQRQIGPKDEESEIIISGNLV